MGKMMFAVNLVNNKVVDNLLILLVSNFHGNKLSGLRVITIRSWSPEMFTLWNLTFSACRQAPEHKPFSSIYKSLLHLKSCEMLKALVWFW